MKLLRSKALLITSVLLGVLCEVGFASSEGSDGDSSGGQPQQPPPRVSSDGQGAAGNNGTNSSGNREPHADGGGVHGKDKEEKKNYRNPFSYEPKGVVIVVIIVGAFVMMAIVCKYCQICFKLQCEL